MNVSRSIPAVTAIIPAFNAALWLPALFEGLDQQTFRDFEAIFVNDGSTDNTGALLDTYAASRTGVKVLHQANGGVGKARNTGVDAAAGTFVVFIDADDAVSPSHLADLYSLATFLDLDVAMCNGWRFYKTPGDAPNEPLVTKPRPEIVMSGIEWYETTFNDEEWWGFPWMTMVRLDFLRRHAILFIEGVNFEDNLWNVMVQSRAARVAYTPKQSYYYRWTPGSILSDQSISRKLWRVKSYVIVIEEMWRMADSETPLIARMYKRLAAREGRTLLRRLAELRSFRLRISISQELWKRCFLSRMFREVETGMHRKRIARAYFFACLGMITKFLRIGETSLFYLEKSIK